MPPYREMKKPPLAYPMSVFGTFNHILKCLTVFFLLSYFTGAFNNNFEISWFPVRLLFVVMVSLNVLFFSLLFLFRHHRSCQHKFLRNFETFQPFALLATFTSECQKPFHSQPTSFRFDQVPFLPPCSQSSSFITEV